MMSFLNKYQMKDGQGMRFPLNKFHYLLLFFVLTFHLPIFKQYRNKQTRLFKTIQELCSIFHTPTLKRPLHFFSSLGFYTILKIRNSNRSIFLEGWLQLLFYAYYFHTFPQPSVTTQTKEVLIEMRDP